MTNPSLLPLIAQGFSASASQEEWRVIADHPDYIVSSLGRVRRKAVNAPILRGDVDRYGYRRVALNGRRRKVHRLVCEAFHGPQPVGHEVGHLDGSRDHNSACNLAWITRRENLLQSMTDGTWKQPINPWAGKAKPFSKVSDAKIKEARERHANGESGRSLAREFGLSPSYMAKVLRGVFRQYV